MTPSRCFGPGGPKQGASTALLTVIQNWIAVTDVSAVTVKFFETRGQRPDRWAVVR